MLVRSEKEARFLSQLREVAPSWTEIGLSGARSTGVPVGRLLLGVELPHLSAPRRWLWIALADSPKGLVFDGQWGDATRSDAGGLTDGDALAQAPRAGATPEEVAAHAAAWIVSQGRRAVRREEWVGRRPGTRWVFADSEAVLFDPRPSATVDRAADIVAIEQSAAAVTGATAVPVPVAVAAPVTVTAPVTVAAPIAPVTVAAPIADPAPTAPVTSISPIAAAPSLIPAVSAPVPADALDDEQVRAAEEPVVAPRPALRGDLRAGRTRISG